LFFGFAVAEERDASLSVSVHSVAQMFEDQPVGGESGVVSSAVLSAAPGTCVGNSTPVVANGSRMIEFYNCDSKHFFYTRDPNEASSIDNGGAGAGWQRTGLSFDVESANGRNTGVCRFYGHPTIGPNSHFFTLEGSECEGLKSLAMSTPYGQPRWNYEGTAFGAYPVTASSCPSGTNALYRYYNNRGAQNDSNHRFSTVVFNMNASGWTPEGVVMCVGAAPQSAYPLTISLYGTGNGTVTSSPSGINCGSDCSESYSASTTVTLAAMASSNANFTGWGGACSGTGSCVVTMDAAKSVTATFAAQITPSLYSLTVSKSGTGDGQITSSPAGISCGSDCSESYSLGSTVALYAVASANSSFTGWGGACSGTNGACVVTMSAAKSVTATFATTPVNPNAATLDLTKLQPGVTKIELGWTDLPICTKTVMEEAVGQVWVCHNSQTCTDTILGKVCYPNLPSCGWETGNLGFQVPILYRADQKVTAYADVTIPQIPKSIDDLRTDLTKIIESSIKDTLSSHVNNTVNNFKENLLYCTIGASAGAVSAAVCSAGSAALPTFLGIFNPCATTSYDTFVNEMLDLPTLVKQAISNTGNQLKSYFMDMTTASAKVYTETQCTNWRRM
jgi:Divergent InlB B-repeat domain